MSRPPCTEGLLSGFANAQTATPFPCPTARCVSMPEPSAIPELLIYLVGIGGFLAWRNHRVANGVLALEIFQFG